MNDRPPFPLTRFRSSRAPLTTFPSSPSDGQGKPSRKPKRVAPRPDGERASPARRTAIRTAAHIIAPPAGLFRAPRQIRRSTLSKLCPGNPHPFPKNLTIRISSANAQLRPPVRHIGDRWPSAPVKPHLKSIFASCRGIFVAPEKAHLSVQTDKISYISITYETQLTRWSKFSSPVCPHLSQATRCRSPRRYIPENLTFGESQVTQRHSRPSIHGPLRPDEYREAPKSLTFREFPLHTSLPKSLTSSAIGEHGSCSRIPSPYVRTSFRH